VVRPLMPPPTTKILSVKAFSSAIAFLQGIWFYFRARLYVGRVTTKP
jgi:hypothetical protein